MKTRFLALILAAFHFHACGADITFSDAPQSTDSATTLQQRLAVAIYNVLNSGIPLSGAVATNLATVATNSALAATAAKQDTANTALTTIAANSASAVNSFRNITSATTTTVKSGAGTLHSITINALGTVASSVTVFDNSAGSGTKIATINSLSISGTLTFDVSFATGLTIVTTGTVAPDITVSYR